jgi:hypothetical protein
MSRMRTLIVAIAAIVSSGILAIVAWYGTGRHFSGFPHYTSRSVVLRVFDGFAEHFAIYTLCALLASLIGCYLWLMLLETGVGNRDQLRNDSTSRKELLLHFERIGNLTSVVGSLAPFMLVQFTFMVIAYHPWVSPTAMPMGLLVLLTLGFGGYVGTALFARWYFRLQRDEALRVLSGPKMELVSDAEGYGERDEMMDRRVWIGRDFTVMEDQLGTNAVATVRDGIEQLSDGVFKPFSESPFAWIAGGGASVALIDVWIRLWTLGL